MLQKIKVVRGFSDDLSKNYFIEKQGVIYFPEGKGSEKKGDPKK